MSSEIRSWLVPASVEADGKTIVGCAIKYDSLSRDLGGFREIIKPGAATEALRGRVVALIEHQLPEVLANSVDGQLTFESRSDGEYFRLTLPDTTTAKDLAAKMKHNPSVYGASFRMPKGSVIDKWYKSAKDGVIRIIEKIKEIPEISITAFPAYEATTAQLRSGIDLDKVTFEPAISPELAYLQTVEYLQLLKL